MRILLNVSGRRLAAATVSTLTALACLLALGAAPAALAQQTTSASEGAAAAAAHSENTFGSTRRTAAPDCGGHRPGDAPCGAPGDGFVRVTIGTSSALLADIVDRMASAVVG